MRFSFPKRRSHGFKEERGIFCELIKKIRKGSLGNSPHKFVWYNRGEEEFSRLTKDKVIGDSHAKGRWIFISLDPGYTLLLGECGGRLLFHPSGSPIPKKYHLFLTFTDDSSLTLRTQLWGAMELYERGEELNREYIKGMRTTPLDPEFTFDYFSDTLDGLIPEKKRSVKALLTQEQIIPGLGNAIAQDIMYRSRLHPRHPIDNLTNAERKKLYRAILDTVQEIIKMGGRNDEYDLFNKKGKYIRLMDKNTLGNPCVECGSSIEKTQYLGGTCYFCPTCQKLS